MWRPVVVSQAGEVKAGMGECETLGDPGMGGGEGKRAWRAEGIETGILKLPSESILSPFTVNFFGTLRCVPVLPPPAPAPVLDRSASLRPHPHAFPSHHCYNAGRWEIEAMGGGDSYFGLKWGGKYICAVRAREGEMGTGRMTLMTADKAGAKATVALFRAQLLARDGENGEVPGEVPSKLFAVVGMGAKEKEVGVWNDGQVGMRAEGEIGPELEACWTLDFLK